MQNLESWLSWLAERSGPPGRPWVSLCYAQSLDGSLTSQPGRPLVLSGPQSSELTHRLRATHQAILVGVGTVLADNPRLTVRLAPGSHPQPVVLDSRLRLPLDCFLLRQHPLKPWVACTPGSDPHKLALLQQAGARLLLGDPEADGGVSLPFLLGQLSSLGIERLMVEGGVQVLTSFMQQGLADQVVITVAPMLVGGVRCPAELLVGQQGAFPRLQPVAYHQLGEDLIVIGQLARDVT